MQGLFAKCDVGDNDMTWETKPDFTSLQYLVKQFVLLAEFFDCWLDSDDKE